MFWCCRSAETGYSCWMFTCPACAISPSALLRLSEVWALPGLPLGCSVMSLCHAEPGVGVGGTWSRATRWMHNNGLVFEIPLLLHTL
jgi:hypothetical protein